ncbi:MAG: glycosyltransferase [Acidobacteriota bacterium]|nr:glycosyltransferase [Acidobacteriota bacterium]
MRLLKESHRYRVHIACLDGSGVLREEVDRLDLGEIGEFPLTSFYDRNAARQLRRFTGFLRDREINLIQVFDFYTNIFGMVGAAVARVPVRIAARRETDGMRTNAQKWAERRAFGLAHAIVANSEAVRQQLTRDGVPAQKIVTIYNGIDIERVRPLTDLPRDRALALLKLPREGRRRFVTIVANMHHPVKDQATFLRAARIVREAVTDAAFVLAGEGKMAEPLRALATQLGLSGSAFFLGRCGNIPELLAVSDVCVLSSKGVEGFSNSIMEYMAAARPVVATDVGGAREAIVEGETGYIVPPGDEVMLAERITSLLKDSQRAREMGESGLRLIRQKFSCEAQLEHTENLYDQLLSRAGTTTRFLGACGESEVAEAEERRI